MKARERLEALSAGVPVSAGRVRLELGDVAWLRLDNPAARNAVTVRMMIDLLDAVETLRAWEGALVVLTSSTPGTFCSGGHLGEVQRSLIEPESGRQMALAMGEVLEGLLDLPQLSVAVVDGPAIGGGAELLTACDLRVLSPRARVHFVHARLGVVPGWGGTARLVRLVGRAAALRILARAEALGPEACREIGLADAVGDPEAWLAPIRELPPETLRAAKAQVLAAPALGAQAHHFASVWGGPAHQRALAALRGPRR